MAGLDPLTGQLTRLFHPRADVWEEHFAWHGVRLLGQTAIDRTTVAVLDMNHPDAVALRGSLGAEGLLDG